MKTEFEVKILNINIDDIIKKLEKIGAIKITERNMKRYVYIGAVSFVLLVGLLLNVHAKHQGGSMYGSKLSQMDTNKDNAVSFEEYSAFHEAQLRWSFKAVDTDNDGLISQGEWNEFLKMHGFDYSHKNNQKG